jgi:hypothetical protein
LFCSLSDVTLLSFLFLTQLDLPLNPLLYKWLKGDTMSATTLPPAPPFTSSSSHHHGASSSSSSRGKAAKSSSKHQALVDFPVFTDADMADLDPDLARTYYQLLAVVHKKER